MNVTKALLSGVGYLALSIVVLAVGLLAIEYLGLQVGLLAVGLCIGLVSTVVAAVQARHKGKPFGKEDWLQAVLFILGLLVLGIILWTLVGPPP